MMLVMICLVLRLKFSFHINSQEFFWRQIMRTYNVIITDDMDDIHQSLRGTLNNIGLNVEITCDFYNTDDLCDYLFDNQDNIKEDILFLDQNYGGVGLTGLEALPEIREYSKDILIVLLTTDDSDKEKYLNAENRYGCVYITKPVSAHQLKNILKKVVKDI